MSLDIEFSSLQADIFEGRKDIAVFLVKGRFYYLADDKENFCIDVRPEYRSYVERGVLQEELYDAALFQFRGGVPVLNCETFEVYVKNNNLALLSVEWMRGFFRHSLPAGYFSQLYRKLSDGQEERLVMAEWEVVRSRLPKFYIDFDKNIFQHMDWDRCHEDYVPQGWNAKASSEFGMWVPENYKYWCVLDMDFWRFLL